MMEQHEFQADAQQILKLVTHSLYSDKEVFLRELLSNSSDALNKARLISARDEDSRKVEDPNIRIFFDEETNTITIEDDGVGMTREEVVENLGTIAQSGTKAFLEKLEDGDKLDALIGQFGVGFYSAFIVAKKVTVDTLSIQSDAAAIRWESDGTSSYAIGDSEKETRGTKITLHLNEDSTNFCQEFTVKDIVKKHSDFIDWPIMIGEERINQDTALWLRNPNEITSEEYKEFYKSFTNNYDEPLCTIHINAEGPLNFNALLFVPQKHSWQLDHANYKVDIKLFQKRVKVLDSSNDILPKYLRFVCGVVDSPDLQLNVSREILQQTPILKKIQKQIVKQVLVKIEETTEDNKEGYESFWSDMGYMLKEGLADFEVTPKQKERLFKLFRCYTTKSQDTLRTLEEIKEDMVEGQENIWYLTDINKDLIANRPILEGFEKRNYEVMLLSDPVDEWVVMQNNKYGEIDLKSVVSEELPEDETHEETEEERADKDQSETLVGWLGSLLDNDVAEVRVSNRLTSSPSVLVSQEGAMSANLQNILKATGQNMDESKQVLEINPSHPMVKTLAKLNSEGKEGLEPFAQLLLDHASIADGNLTDHAGFAKRLQALMEKAAQSL